MDEEQQEDIEIEGQSPIPSRYNQLLQKTQQQQIPQMQNEMKRSARQNTNSSKLNRNSVQQQDQALSMLAGKNYDNLQSDNQCMSCQVMNRGLAYNKLVSNQSIVYSQNIPVQSQTSFNTLQAAHNDVLFLTASEDSNPQFLYFTTIDIETFLQLRKTQNFHIDFNQLPERMVQLLNFCGQNFNHQQDYFQKSQQQNTEENEEDENRFFCQFTTSPSQNSEQQDQDQLATVEIFENNQFRNLLHYKITMEKATHEEARKWLGKKLLIQKHTNIELLQENEELREKVEEDENLLQQMQKSFQTLKEDNDRMLELKEKEGKEQVDLMESNKNEEIQNLQEQYDNQMDQFQQETEAEKRRNTEEINRLRQQLYEMTTQKDQLQEISSQYKFRSEQLTADLATSQRENLQLSTQAEQLRQQNAKLDKNLLEQTLLKDQGLKQIDQLNDQNKKQQLQIIELQDSQEQYRQLSDSLKEKIILIQEQVKSLENEVDKNEKQINKLNEKNHKYKGKYKNKKKEAKKLDQQILELNQALNARDQNINQGKEEQEKLNQEISSKDETIQLLQQKLKECEDILKSNSSMIEYLNKSLNEAQKVTFRTMVNQRGQDVTTDVTIRNRITSTNIMKSSTGFLSPIRRDDLENVNATMGKPQVISGTYQILDKNFAQAEETSLRKIHEPLAQNLYLPSKNLKMPLTEFYLNKQGESSKSPNFQNNQDGYVQSSFGYTHMGQTASLNPFSTQLQRDQIVSSDKLRTRFDYNYQPNDFGASKYDGSPNRGQYQGSIKGQSASFKTQEQFQFSHLRQSNHISSIHSKYAHLNIPSGSTLNHIQSNTLGTLDKDNGFNNNQLSQDGRESQRDNQNNLSIAGQSFNGQSANKGDKKTLSVKFDDSRQ
ncbi:spindle assembly abnormal protein 6 homolog [Stylonychia lemnae]|uniref:Spindle assembly abnormal protein 6 homolog n=1 Tax=Stylonychia lemnae TaxID=5949 RepID=A0A078AG83_STYLE|nr:spindle assembly abnormal protein 6 homolog [Stylonychia lemnae]|eukprot:CDW79868.1 spindle assembly abnormal protein 6 homolog [Stylonychia lemnae]